MRAVNGKLIIQLEWPYGLIDQTTIDVLVYSIG